ncbi:vacuolar protein 8 [Lycium ferocissimum]|uniref:vacuolar protein 8 n=1 Tax=Lycium ferocissimum TaxID=112874 RepID=UPI0028159CE9|nr:vacuolar protein 8 [Lycium ferocissimum]
MKSNMFTSLENQELAGKSRIRQTIEFISSLISLSYSIKVFPVKWQSIRNKLEELLSSLSAIENCDSTENYSPLFSSLQAITVTLKNCHELSRHCVEFSYSGKLLMQSDLDIVSTKLENHIKGISEIYSLGLLTQSYAIIVPKPSLGASRDDINFYIRDLLSRIKIGSSEMKKQALIALNEVIQEDDTRYVKVAIEIDGFVSLLVSFLDLQEDNLQEEAAKALSVIAGFQSFRGGLISAGIIAPLIRVLECGNCLSKEYASRCLMKVTENSDNAWSISAHGGVTVLLKICTEAEDNFLVGSVCGVLKNLVGVEEIKRFMIEEGAISVFIKLVRSKDEVTQISSIDFLQTMATGDESTRQMIMKEGGVRALACVLDPKSSSSSKAREMALRGIVNLCFSSVNSVNILLSHGFLDHILYYLRHRDSSLQELALKAAFWLCGTSDEAKKLMGDAGFMAELVKFLDSKSFEVREMAAETLSSMVIVPRNQKRFVQNDQNVGLLLQMLDPEQANFVNKKLLLSILMSLTSCNCARKKIANSEYLINIEKLAEAEVSDAKKIVRKLSSNRFKNILNGIWHS